jgi:two-component system sensor histidine kinase AlgZ
MTDAAVSRPDVPVTAVTAEPARGLRLPDLCDGTAVLFLGLIGVLLAFCFVLFDSGLAAFDWIGLGRAVAFICWNMLASAAALCGLAPWLRRLPLPAGACAALCAMLGVLLFSTVAQSWLLGSVIAGYPFRVDASGLARNLLIGALLGIAALRYFHLQGELIERERAELAARIRALQARIRPHFLFNSMNIIASLIPEEPAQAERAVLDLAELFRASLREGPATAPVAEELDLCERYMRLEGWRLGKRLRFESRVEPLPAGASLPPLCVQPLLENAVYHGIQPAQQGGVVRLAVSAAGGRLRIEVSTPLPPPGAATTGSGMALANIRSRLAAIYGDAAELSAAPDGAVYKAVLSVPAQAPA